MFDLGTMKARKTGLALSALTALVLLVGYVGVQWLEGNWQPSSLDLLPGTTQTAATQPTQQPLVLKPNISDGTVPTGWEMPSDEESIETALRDREVK